MAATNSAEPAPALPEEQLAADLEPVIQAAEASEQSPTPSAGTESQGRPAAVPIRQRLEKDARDADAILGSMGKQVTPTVPLDLQPLAQELDTLAAMDDRAILKFGPLREDPRYQQIQRLVAAANASLTEIRLDTDASEHVRQRRQAALTSAVARAIAINSTAITEEMFVKGIWGHPRREALNALSRISIDTADQAAGILEPGTQLAGYLAVTREMDKLVTALEALAPPSQRRIPTPSWPEALTRDALRHSLPRLRRSPAAQAAADITRRWTRLDAALERFEDDRRLNGLGRTLRIRSAEILGTLARYLVHTSNHAGSSLGAALWGGVHHWACETAERLRGMVPEGEDRELGYYLGNSPNRRLSTAYQDKRRAWEELKAIDPDDLEAPTLTAQLHAGLLLANLTIAEELGASNGLDGGFDPTGPIGFPLQTENRTDRIAEWSRVRTAILDRAEGMSERNPRRAELQAWAERLHHTIAGEPAPASAAAARLTVADIQEFAQRALETQEPSPLVLADTHEAFERAQHALAVMERLGIVSGADATRPEGPSRRAMLITDPDELQQALLRAEAELATYRANLPTDSPQQAASPPTKAPAAAEASTAQAPDGPAAEPPASAGPTAPEAAPSTASAQDPAAEALYDRSSHPPPPPDSYQEPQPLYQQPPASAYVPDPVPPSAEPQPQTEPAAVHANPEEPKSTPEQSDTAPRPRTPSNARVASLLMESGERVKALTADRPQATAAQSSSPAAAAPMRPQDQAPQQDQQPLARTAGPSRG